MDEPILILLIFLGIITFIGFLVSYISSPFSFPYKEITFNVTGTRQPQIEDYIDQYLIQHKLTTVNSQMQHLTLWKRSCEEKIQKSLFKKRRAEQYQNSCDEKNMFVFVFVRQQTRYKQVNYVRHPYKVSIVVQKFPCSYDFLLSRYNALENINFEATLSAYHSKSQRSLMTRELRDEIAERDDYTCQVCGKVMLDGVGLQIDHIIPVAKGGKSVPSNLQVLCSKCNGRKSSKTSSITTYTNTAPVAKSVESSSRSPQISQTQSSYILEELEYNSTYSSKLIEIENQIILAYEKNDIEQVMLLTSKAESITKRTINNSISLHFFYQRIANVIYARRAQNEDAIKHCLYFCDKDIDLVTSIKYGAGGSITTITRKAIILEKEKEYSKAIELCNLAIENGYLDNKESFAVRKSRLEAKLSSSIQ